MLHCKVREVSFETVEKVSSASNISYKLIETTGTKAGIDVRNRVFCKSILRVTLGMSFRRWWFTGMGGAANVPESPLLMPPYHLSLSDNSCVIDVIYLTTSFRYPTLNTGIQPSRSTCFFSRNLRHGGPRHS